MRVPQLQFVSSSDRVEGIEVTASPTAPSLGHRHTGNKRGGCHSAQRPTPASHPASYCLALLLSLETPSTSPDSETTPQNKCAKNSMDTTARTVMAIKKAGRITASILDSTLLWMSRSAQRVPSMSSRTSVWEAHRKGKTHLAACETEKTGEKIRAFTDSRIFSLVTKSGRSRSVPATILSSPELKRSSKSVSLMMMRGESGLRRARNSSQ